MLKYSNINIIDVYKLSMEIRHVNETQESRSFFLDPGESRLATARQQAYCERDNCHLSLRACY